MIDVHELDRIEHWRRGIADAETASVAPSVATSVEGEFITPMAARSMGHLPTPRDRSAGSHQEKSREERKKKKHRRVEQLEDDPERTVVGSESSSKSRGSKSSKREKVLVKVKKPSPLRRIFSSKDTDSCSRR
jgi:hypothetical protein